MSTMVQPTKNRRLRRQFDDEFKASAVRLVLDDGKSAGRVARDLDLTESALRRWVDQAQADRAHGVDDRGTGGVAAVAKRESRTADRSRDPIKKSRPSSRSTKRKVCVDRCGEGLVSRCPTLSGARRVGEWLLRLADPPGVEACPPRPSAPRAAACLLCGQSADLWEPAVASRPAGARASDQSQTGRPVATGGRPHRAGTETLQAHEQ